MYIIHPYNYKDILESLNLNENEYKEPEKIMALFDVLIQNKKVSIHKDN